MTAQKLLVNSKKVKLSRDLHGKKVLVNQNLKLVRTENVADLQILLAKYRIHLPAR